MTEPAVELRGVSKSFGSVRAVQDLDLRIPRGSIYGLLGPNGAGKTTAIRMILDILGPDAGRVRVFGQRVDDRLRERVGYLPEERGLYAKMDVAEHLAFLGELKGLAHGAAEAEARRWLERLDLGDWADNRVEDLSKGMQQKVQFAGTVLHAPDLLILDEPFAGLDPLNVEVLKEVVAERHEEGTTVLFSTHQIEDAERLCERVCMIAGARKVLDGTVGQVKASSGRQNVEIAFEGSAAFLDAPGVVDRVTRRGRLAEVTLTEGADPQELLRRAVDSGAEVERFEVVEPSLRQIFLERAGRKGLEEEAREEGASPPEPGGGAPPAGAARSEGGPPGGEGGP